MKENISIQISWKFILITSLHIHDTDFFRKNRTSVTINILHLGVQGLDKDLHLEKDLQLEKDLHLDKDIHLDKDVHMDKDEDYKYNLRENWQECNHRVIQFSKRS